LWLERGRLADAQGHPEDAEESYIQVFDELDETMNYDLARELLETFWLSDRVRKSDRVSKAELLARALVDTRRQDPTHTTTELADSLYRLGYTLEQLGQFEEAKLHYGECIKTCKDTRDDIYGSVDKAKDRLKGLGK